MSPDGPPDSRGGGTIEAPDRTPRVRISVVVPAYGQAAQLAECLNAIRTAAGRETEIIVVDDASPEDLAAVGAAAGARMIRLARNSGPAAARNRGAQQARGDILFFVDSDVVVAPDAIRRVGSTLEAHPDVAAVFGSYDARPRAPGVVSQYRNLLHHFVHQNANREASTFWAGCGAVRRGVFVAVGGFDPERFPRPSIEDIELGYRLRRAGHRITLDRALQGTHLKLWTFLGVLHTDVVGRAIPWSRLIQESRRMPDDLNVRWSQRVCVGLVGLAAVGLALVPVQPAAAAGAAAALGAVVGINRRLFAFLARERGPWFAAACVPLHVLHYLCAGSGYLYAWTIRRFAPLRRRIDGIRVSGG